eukprot:Skav235058  [mRNA]  locus=scaffold3697:223895:237894:- [translate_table: standard]
MQAPPLVRSVVQLGGMAVGLPAPPLRVISQAKIDSLCNLAGFTENIMEFHVHIASPLEVNSGFFFQGSELTRGTLLRCWPETLTEAKLNSDNGFCEVGENVVTGLPELKMYVLRGTFPAGLHIFRFRRVRNPLHPTDAMGYFSFGTYTDLHQYPKHKVLDQSKDVPVPRMLQLLPLTGLVEAPDYERPSYGRNDAPMRLNLMTFYFQVLNSSLDSAQQLLGIGARMAGGWSSGLPAQGNHLARM